MISKSDKQKLDSMCPVAAAVKLGTVLAGVEEKAAGGGGSFVIAGSHPEGGTSNGAAVDVVSPQYKVPAGKRLVVEDVQYVNFTQIEIGEPGGSLQISLESDNGEGDTVAIASSTTVDAPRVMHTFPIVPEAAIVPAGHILNLQISGEGYDGSGADPTPVETQWGSGQILVTARLENA